MGQCICSGQAFRPGTDWHDDGKYTRFVSGLPSPFANMICNARFDAATADRDIAEALKPIKERGVPALWIAGPNSQPLDLPQRLQDAGLVSERPMRAMAIDLSKVADIQPQSSIQIEAVGDQDGLNQWIEVLASGYETPSTIAELFGYWAQRYGMGTESHFRGYIAWYEGRPAACSQLFLDEGVAGVYCVATIPGARRKGIGSAITTHALLEARSAGYRVGVLQASEMGASVYRNIGFRDFGPIHALVWVP